MTLPLNLTFSAISAAKRPALVVLVDTSRKPLPEAAKLLGKKGVAALARDLKPQTRFTGKAGQTLLLPAPEGVSAEWLGVVAVGKDMDAKALRKAGGAAAKLLDGAGIKHAALVVEQPKGSKLKPTEVAAEIGYGALLKSYRFDKYRTTLKDEQKPALTKLDVLLAKDAKAASALFKARQAVAEGVFFTRDLVSEPANIIYPESLAAACKTLSKMGVSVEVLGEAQMKKLGMGALLGVGQGSERESQLVVMRWNGGAKTQKPIAFVGKGVTFDTGGISIKPAGGMEEMKWDMGGAGAVIGLMKALAGRKAKANVIGVVGLVENMPSGNAQRPGDVVKTMAGLTVEVINTDAEGRLVLADALWYTQHRFKPQFMVNLATLTGAIIVSLGKSRAGLFSNNDALAEKLFKTGEAEGERLWRLPVGEEYETHIDSDIADIKNVGKAGQAGSISAAQFLSRFVNNVPWAHLDIAGVAWTHEEQDLARKGATGFGVRLLDRFVHEHYEK